MHISVEIPEHKGGLDAALSKQFASMQKQLMGLIKSQQSFQKSQQSSLVSAMKKLMESVGKMRGSDTSSELASALKGMKKSISGLPKDLRIALNGNFKVRQERIMSRNGRAPNITVRPNVTVKPNITVKIPSDSLTKAMNGKGAFGSLKFKNRTFGSNN